MSTQHSALPKRLPMRKQVPAYRNVLEFLVISEVERQLHQLPSQLLTYIKPAEVAAYALNRLPPLYATSIEGWQRQRARARAELWEKIHAAVRQGIAAVQRDPLKASTPLDGWAALDEEMK